VAKAVQIWLEGETIKLEALSLIQRRIPIKQERSMGKVIVVTSGKGGVGKTTSTAALGAALAQTGDKVVVVDFDVGLRNLDLVMGAERRVVYDLVNVIQGEAKLDAGTHPRQAGRDALPAAGFADARQGQPHAGRRREGRIALKSAFDWVICDSPAGIERGATLAMRHADVAIVVTNPEVSSVRDSDRIIGLLDSKTLKAENGEHDGEAPASHTLRFGPRRARGHAEGRRRPRNPVDPAARHHPGKHGRVLRASNLGSPVTLADAAARLRSPISRPRAGSRAKFCRHHSGRKARLSSARSSEGKRHESFRLFSRTQSAPAARERLQVLLAHERAAVGDSDLVTKLRDEILRVRSPSTCRSIATRSA
jgi:septum site-determining protein MinD